MTRTMPRTHAAIAPGLPASAHMTRIVTRPRAGMARLVRFVHTVMTRATTMADDRGEDQVAQALPNKRSPSVARIKAPPPALPASSEVAKTIARKLLQSYFWSRAPARCRPNLGPLQRM